MRRILSLLLCLGILALPFPAIPQTDSSTFRMVAKGSVTQTNMRISAVAGTSFVDFSVADVLTSKLGYLLVVKDSSGRKIQGWIKAAGTGETSTESITGWGTATGMDTLTVNVNGHDIDAAINSSGDGYFRTSPAFTLMALYKINGATTDNSAQGLPNYEFNNTVLGTSVTNLYRTLIDATRLYIQIYRGSPYNISALCSALRVLTPSTTGVTITSTKGGAVYNFANKSSSFNYNDSSDYTYEIWQSTTAPVVASGGTITQENTRLDLTDTNAFVWLNGVDLSPYQDGRHMIGIYNVTGGYGILGHISSVKPQAETLATAKGLTGITKANPGVVTYSGGHGYSNGQLVYLSGLTQMTELNTKYRTLQGNVGDTFTIGDTSSYGLAETTGGNCSQNVTDPAVTGVRIVSTKGGSNRAFFYKNALFNPNDSSGVTYKIFYVGDTAQVDLFIADSCGGSGTDSQDECRNSEWTGFCNGKRGVFWL